MSNYNHTIRSSSLNRTLVLATRKTRSEEGVYLRKDHATLWEHGVIHRKHVDKRMFVALGEVEELMFLSNGCEQAVQLERVLLDKIFRTRYEKERRKRCDDEQAGGQAGTARTPYPDHPRWLPCR